MFKAFFPLGFFYKVYLQPEEGGAIPNKKYIGKIVSVKMIKGQPYAILGGTPYRLRLVPSPYDSNENLVPLSANDMVVLVYTNTWIEFKAVRLSSTTLN